MEKLLKIIKVFFGVIWVPVLFFFHLGIAASCDNKDGDWFVAVILILIRWILSVVTYIIYDNLSKRSARCSLYTALRSAIPTSSFPSTSSLP